MKCYIVKESLNEKIVGTQYPQVWDFIKGYRPEPEYNGVYSLYENEFPAKDPDLSGLKLANGSQFTDFLSSAFDFNLFLLSIETKTLFEKMNMEECRFYPAKVVSLRKKTERDYFMMKILSEKLEYVDFKRSSFIVENLYSSEKKGTIEIESLLDFRTKLREIWKQANGDLINATTTKMLPSFFDLDLDMFHISNPPRWYISTKLHDRIVEFKLTGWEFTEVDL
jgi:hypothetical protein